MPCCKSTCRVLHASKAMQTLVNWLTLWRTCIPNGMCWGLKRCPCCWGEKGCLWPTNPRGPGGPPCCGGRPSRGGSLWKIPPPWGPWFCLSPKEANPGLPRPPCGGKDGGPWPDIGRTLLFMRGAGPGWSNMRWPEKRGSRKEKRRNSNRSQNPTASILTTSVAGKRLDGITKVKTDI